MCVERLPHTCLFPSLIALDIPHLVWRRSGAVVYRGGDTGFAGRIIHLILRDFVERRRCFKIVRIPNVIVATCLDRERFTQLGCTKFVVAGDFNHTGTDPVALKAFKTEDATVLMNAAECLRLRGLPIDFHR